MKSIIDAIQRLDNVWLGSPGFISMQVTHSFCKVNVSLQGVEEVSDGGDYIWRISATRIRRWIIIYAGASSVWNILCGSVDVSRRRGNCSTRFSCVTVSSKEAVNLYPIAESFLNAFLPLALKKLARVSNVGDHAVYWLAKGHLLVVALLKTHLIRRLRSSATRFTLEHFMMSPKMRRVFGILRLCRG